MHVSHAVCTCITASWGACCTIFHMLDRVKSRPGGTQLLISCMYMIFCRLSKLRWLACDLNVLWGT